MLLVNFNTLEDGSPARTTYSQSKPTDNISLDKELQVPDAAARHCGWDPHDRQASRRHIGLGMLRRRVDQAPSGQRIPQRIADVASELVEAVQVVISATRASNRERMVPQTPRRMDPARRRRAGSMRPNLTRNAWPAWPVVLVLGATVAVLSRRTVRRPTAARR
jgi:hypothetical protein